MLSPRALSKGTRGSAWYVRLFPLIDDAHLHMRLFTRAAYQRSLPRLTERHDLQQRIRDFLKVRTSYDVLPLSFRLIIFDTALLVKKSLTILIQNGNIPPAAQSVATMDADLSGRHRLRPAMGLEDILFRRTVDDFRLPQPHSILLAKSRSCEPH